MKYFLIITTPAALNMRCFSSMHKAYNTLIYYTFIASAIIPPRGPDPKGEKPGTDEPVMPTIDVGSNCDTSHVAYKNNWANFRIVETEDDVTQYALYYEENGAKTTCTLYGSIIEARWAMEAAVTAIQQSMPELEWKIIRQENGVVLTAPSDPPQHHAWRVFKLDDSISVLF